MLNMNTSPASAKYVESLILSNFGLITPWWTGYIWLKLTSLDSNIKQDLCVWSACTDTDQKSWYISCKAIPSSACVQERGSKWFWALVVEWKWEQMFPISQYSQVRTLFLEEAKSKLWKEISKSQKKGVISFSIPLYGMSCKIFDLWRPQVGRALVAEEQAAKGAPGQPSHHTGSKIQRKEYKGFSGLYFSF